MPICFELVVNFGTDLEAAQAAALSPRLSTVHDVGRYRIPLHSAFIDTDVGHVELSLIPVAVGHRVAMDGSLPRFDLTAEELTELGNQLYRVLAKFDGYVAAKVGWEPWPLLFVDDLKTRYLKSLSDGSVHGLVLSEALHAELGLGPEYVEFQPGYRWIPYRGDEPRDRGGGNPVPSAGRPAQGTGKLDRLAGALGRVVGRLTR